MDARRFTSRMLVLTMALSLAAAGRPAMAEDAMRAAIGTEVSNSSGIAGTGMRALVAPVLWLLGLIGVPVEEPAPPRNSLALAPGAEWRTLEFPVRDFGCGVYLEVVGRVEFDRAEIRLGDGSTRSIDLHRAVRGGGLYELLALTDLTRVDAVVLHARSRSTSPWVGVRLGRVAPDPAQSAVL